ncbi:hypothetical protein SEA_AMORE2_72 [Gordonia phage Amore2]|nr:hypothetical protein SEA_AMORE2_72 [Gordonia phage Amore2]
MAKALGPCMFCEEMPCICNGARPKPKAKPKPKPKAQTKTEPKAVVKSPAPDEKPEPPKRRGSRRFTKDLATHRAVQVFAGLEMLDRKELRTHAERVDPPVTGRLLDYLEGGEDG